jgi:hypothetical protein
VSERDTPYDIVFRRGDIDFDARFADVRAEAEERGVPLDEPERFVMLGAVGTLLRDMILEDAAADEVGEIWQALPPQAIAQAGALLFHAFRFREAGADVVALDEEATRALLAGGSARTSAPAPAAQPSGAGYVQLPRNLIWARADDSGPAEPLDGFFWTLGRRFDVLLALGVRPRRPGFTAIPIGVELTSPADLMRIAGTPARTEGDDFANILPGGELNRLLGLTSTGEALRLAALSLLELHARGDG